MTPRQVELLEREDWRFHAIDAAGTGLGMMATTEKLGRAAFEFRTSVRAGSLSESSSHREQKSRSNRR